MRYFGCHVSAAGGLANALANGKTLGINTIQIHPSAPQRWNYKAFAADVEAQFLADRAASGIEKVFFHAIYLINLAAVEEEHYARSKTSLVYYLDLIHRIQGDGVIFHVGSLKDHAEEAPGLRRAAEAINWILEHAPHGKLILEVAAGGGQVVGDRLEELAEIYSHVEQKDRVGYGLDSQHLWASGYNLREDLDSIVKQLETIFSFEKIWAIHLNDSKTEFASRKDRHENIGDGLIGMEACRNFFCHPKLSSIPFILETPAMKSLETAATEVSKLRSMIAGE